LGRSARRYYTEFLLKILIDCLGNRGNVIYFQNQTKNGIIFGGVHLLSTIEADTTWNNYWASKSLTLNKIHSLWDTQWFLVLSVLLWSGKQIDSYYTDTT
jgi:hypothetical protein